MYISATEAKTHLGKYLKQLNEDKEPVYIVRHGKIAAVLKAAEPDQNKRRKRSTANKSLQ